ncbi:MAG: hypothetical protein GY854_09510 [Deltaproteobacteria bacterium]|nr:hypothetical protein [Deltaproteobacteria bacterium]
MKKIIIIMSSCLGLLIGCGHAPPAPERVVLVETEPDEEEADAGVEPESKNDLVDQILEDEHRSARIIQDVMTGDDGELAAWAAVYAMRLGIQHDENTAARALRGGVSVKDPVLAALCWRWLASLPPKRIPKWTGGKRDPVVHAMAALALSRRGSLPKPLQFALGVPRGKPYGPDKGAEAKDRVEQLLGLATPFDTGPLALAVAFAEAQRGEWVERGPGGELVWVAHRLREELVKLVLEKDPAGAKRVGQSKEVRGVGFTGVGNRLETSLVQRDRKTLLVAAMTGEASLRVEALRAISIVAVVPVSGDFGAAASALEAKEPSVRLEGARTFLLLSIRAHAEETQ